MDLSKILSPTLCFPKHEGRSQKRVFETIAEKISNQEESLDYADIFDALSARERLGSTGLGEGVAIPHCRIEYDGEALGAVMTLSEPIGFDSPDLKPVDILVFLMVSGDANQEHLDTLATLAKFLSEETHRTSLRNAQTSADLHSLVVSGTAPSTEPLVES